MSLADDLLIQSQTLLRKEPRRPRQASLRHAISSAYYALFHMLIADGSKIVTANEIVRGLVARTFVHGVMKKAAAAFSSGTLPRRLASVNLQGAIPPQLQSVATALVDLQEARHDADYNTVRRFTRSEACDVIDRASLAISDWRRIRGHEHAKLFLISLMLWDRWERVL
jgi:uncharacterized protein (UPF0332 family)